jgi:hypothetical protein
MNTLKKIHEAATKSNKSEDLIEFFMVILQKKKYMRNCCGVGKSKEK